DQLPPFTRLWIEPQQIELLMSYGCIYPARAIGVDRGILGPIFFRQRTEIRERPLRGIESKYLRIGIHAQVDPALIVLGQAHYHLAWRFVRIEPSPLVDVVGDEV